MYKPKAGYNPTMRLLGSYLNDINEKYKCNTPAKTVKTTKIMLYHRPDSTMAMLHQLKIHTEKQCAVCHEKCNNNGLPGWVDMLFLCLCKEQEAKNPKAMRFTRRDCEQFVHELYVESPMQGYLKEKEAMHLLRACGFKFEHASPHDDIAYAIDLIDERCAVQVKPISYLRMQRMKVHSDNIGKNKLYGKPVVYMYYDRDVWVNLAEVLASLAALQPSPYERLF
jgi:hypothetical protein